MGLSVTLQNQVIDFLRSLPNLGDTKSRQAFIYSVGLDLQLQDQIPFDEHPAQFVPILVSKILKYGILKDGRNALEAVLETAKNYVGQEKREECDSLIKQLYVLKQVTIQQNIVESVKLYNVPNLPPNFLAREEEVVHLKEIILKNNPIIVIQGMGGVGKSVIASKLSRDEKIQNRFHDGIFWLVIGQTPNLTLRQANIANIIDDRSYEFKDEEDGKTHLSRLLGNKACLIILDDIWNIKHINAFDRIGTKCCLLITTRHKDIATNSGGVKYELDLLNDQQSLELLANWVDKPAENLPKEAKEILKECKNLPLAIAMIGAMIKDNPNRWDSVLYKLRHAELTKIKRQFPDYQYADLYNAIDVSVRALESDVQIRYLDFAIFPEDIKIPEIVIETFWINEGLHKYDVEDIIDILSNRSLIQHDSTGYISLHDLQFDYLKKVSDLKETHKRFIDAYRIYSKNDLLEIQSNGYYYEYLHFHLIEAEEWEELVQILCNIKFLKITAGRLKNGNEIYSFLKECLYALPESYKSNNRKLSNMSKYLEDFSHCIDIYNLGSLDEKACCKECGERSIIHGYIDRGAGDFYDNYISWCTSCFWAWYKEEYYMSGYEDPVLVFNYDTNTYM